MKRAAGLTGLVALNHFKPSLGRRPHRWLRDEAARGTRAAACTYAQLEVVAPEELARIFVGAGE